VNAVLMAKNDNFFKKSDVQKQRFSLSKNDEKTVFFQFFHFNE